jgi:uncharacterized GH25 family protein
MRSFTKTFVAALGLAGAIGSAGAHNLWLMPSSTILSKPDWITVDAAVSNDLFFFNHRPLSLDNLHVTAPDGSPVKPENASSGKLRSVFDLNLAQNGTYRVAVMNTGLFANWKDAAGQTKRWRGTPEAFRTEVPANAQDLAVTQSAGIVETYVTVGKPSTVRPTGQGLELVPVTHPNDLVKGEKATFAFQIDGKPAADLEVVVVYGGSRYRDSVGEMKLKTGADGRFVVSWPTPGVYWMEATAKDAKTALPQAKERRLSYAGTVEVLP